MEKYRANRNSDEEVKNSVEEQPQKTQDEINTENNENAERIVAIEVKESIGIVEFETTQKLEVYEKIDFR